MTKEEAIKAIEEYLDTADEAGHIFPIKFLTALDVAISALKGLDLPDNATNEDALNYMLRQTFPKVIFIHFHNEANLTEGVVMAKEWLSKPYKKGEKDA